MARRAFFSFHYQRDIWRVNQVRNSWVIKPGVQEAVWYDASLWEEAKTKGKSALERLIDEGLKRTSVTVVLIGAETPERPWVQYEIEKSYARKNGLLGIYIHKLKDTNEKTDRKGKNPFDYFYLEQTQSTYLGTTTRQTLFSEIYPTYDWVDDNGYQNIGLWIENAAIKAGR